MSTPPPLDVAALRADTPGLCPPGAWTVHEPKRPNNAPDVAWPRVDDIGRSIAEEHPAHPPPIPIHLNAAGASLPPAPVLSATLEWTVAEATHGAYEAAACPAGLDATDARPKAALARLLHCSPADVALLPSATHAWAQAFGGLAALLKPGDVVLSVGGGEYGSNAVAMLQAAGRTGCVVEAFDSSGDSGKNPGAIDLAALRVRLARGDVALVCCAHAPTGGGWVVDAAGVGAACAAAPAHRVTKTTTPTPTTGIPFLLDACQTAGQVPLDVRALGCWWLSGTGRKFLRGPRGVGFLFASPAARSAFEPAVLDVRGAEWGVDDSGVETYTAHTSARAYEFYETSFAARVGLGVALEYLECLGGPGPTGVRAAGLAAAARTGLSGLRGVAVHDGPGPSLSAIVTFTVAGVPPPAVVASLGAARPRPVLVHASGRSSSARSFGHRGLGDGVVRASFHYYNTEEEVDRLVEAVAAVAAAAAGAG
jgi:cysteine desulfurase / selenocysteine lyase